MPKVESQEKLDSRRALQSRRIKTATKNPDRVRERRESLINAAIAVFIEKGFHNATVRDIGRAANMTQGTIYNYVSSKDDILYMVCDRIVAEYNDQTRRALDTSHDSVGRVRSAVRAISQVMYRHRREILLIYQDSHLLDKRSRRVILARVEEFIGMFERIITDAARELSVPLPYPHLSANMLTFLPVMIALRGWSLKNDVPPEEVIEEITAFIVRGLGFE
ncbi:MAG: TetR/AcrR family transcriptional regulator [Betaproteobacteria bacterium]|nr:MAG: TetR/AcrR family transcriptional regulator [Betaproteobacteria bacterium]